MPRARIRTGIVCQTAGAACASDDHQHRQNLQLQRSHRSRIVVVKARRVKSWGVLRVGYDTTSTVEFSGPPNLLLMASGLSLAMNGRFNRCGASSSWSRDGSPEARWFTG